MLQGGVQNHKKTARVGCIIKKTARVGCIVSFKPILAKNKREAYASLLFLSPEGPGRGRPRRRRGKKHASDMFFSPGEIL